MSRFTSFTALMLTGFFSACATPSMPLVTGLEVSPAASQQNAEGIIRYQMGQWEVAKQHFEAAIEVEPNGAEPHYNLALALHQLGAHAESLTHLKQAAKLAPKNPAITGSTFYRSHVYPPRTSWSRSYGGWSHRHWRLGRFHKKRC